jgi:hypothetical protein
MFTVPPLITLSIGDVSFHLYPRPPNDDGDDARSYPTPDSGSTSPTPPPPIAVVNGGTDDDGDRYYRVDLNSFTGTLKIARSSSSPRTASPPPPPPSSTTLEVVDDESSSGGVHHHHHHHRSSKVPVKSLIDRYGGGRDGRSRSPAPPEKKLDEDRKVATPLSTPKAVGDATTTTMPKPAEEAWPTMASSSTSLSGQDATTTSSSSGVDDGGRRNDEIATTTMTTTTTTTTTAIAPTGTATSSYIDHASQSPQRPRNDGNSSKRVFSLSPPRTKFASIAQHVLHQVALAGKDVVDALESTGVSRRGGSGYVKVGGDGSSRRRNAGDVCDDDYDGDYDGDAHGGTELHVACASEDGVDRVRAMLLRRDDEDLGHDLHSPDRRGRLPIHVLSMNRRLIGRDPDGCEEVAIALIELMTPERAVQALHPSCGLAPFVHAIDSWTERLHSLDGDPPSRGDGKDPPGLSIPVGRSDEDYAGCKSTVRRRRVPYRSLFQPSTVNELSVSSIARAKLLYLPAFVTISDHEVFAIRMLSRLIDDYPEKTREAILTNVASVPLFLKSVLLISDPDKMTEIANTTLVKHVVMDKRTVNVWLCAMLTDTKEVKMRAAIYIKLLSSLTFQDLASTSQSPERYSDKEIERFATYRKETFNAVYCW